MTSTETASAVCDAMTTPTTGILQAVGWAAVTALLAALTAHHRPQNSSFVWRAFSASACLWAAGNCSVQLLLLTGDATSALALTHLGSLFALVVTACLLVSQFNFFWAGDRSQVAYERAVRERCYASRMSETSP